MSSTEEKFEIAKKQKETGDQAFKDGKAKEGKQRNVDVDRLGLVLLECLN